MKMNLLDLKPYRSFFYIFLAFAAMGLCMILLLCIPILQGKGLNKELCLVILFAEPLLLWAMWSLLKQSAIGFRMDADGICVSQIGGRKITKAWSEFSFAYHVRDYRNLNYVIFSAVPVHSAQLRKLADQCRSSGTVVTAYAVTVPLLWKSNLVQDIQNIVPAHLLIGQEEKR